MMSEVGQSRPSGGNTASAVAASSGHAQTMTSSPTPQMQSLSTPSAGGGGGGGENNNEDDDDFINKVCKFEMISRRKVSPTSSSSSPSSTTKSPTTSVGKSPTASKMFFSSDGITWKGGGGRGSGGSAGSGSGSSANNSGQNPTIPLISPYSPHGFVGEKVFTRDTATTRVSASLLQNLQSPSPNNSGGSSPGSGTGTGPKAGQGQAQRVQSSESYSTHSTSSLTNVSTLSWTSDRSDVVTGASETGGQSKNRRGSDGGRRTATSSVAATVGSDIMTSSDPCVFPSVSSNNKEQDEFNTSGVGPLREEDIIYDDVPTPVPSPRVLPAHVTNRSEAAKHRGGVFDSALTSAPSEIAPNHQQNQSRGSESPSRVTPTRETPTRRFVTLSTSDRDSFPSPAVKPLSPSGFPYITPGPASSLSLPSPAKSPSPSSSSSEHLGSFPNGDASGSSSGHLPLYNATLGSNRDSVRSGSSTGSGGHGKTSSSSSASSHRNTFEGMDFEFQELTSQQQQLALRHREVVAERKREQERERMDRQRLEDILKMCEEYQHEVESARPTSSSTATASFSSNISTTSPNKTSPSAASRFPANDATRYPQDQGHHQIPNSHTQGQSHPDQNLPRNARDVSPREQAPPPYSQVASEQPPPPYSPKSIHSPGPPLQPPGQLDINTALASSPTSSIDRKNKIKTNGSLMLGSPNNPYKEFTPPFTYPPQVSATGSPSTSRMAESASAYSSNSEDEAVGSSEDTGTIKKRPGMADGFGAIVGGNLSRQAYPQHPGSNSPLASSNSPRNSPQHSRVHRSRDTPLAAAASNFVGGGSRGGAMTMTADISDDNIVVTTTHDFYDSASATLTNHVSPRSYGRTSDRNGLDQRGGRGSKNTAPPTSSVGDSLPSSSSSSSPTPTPTTTSTVTTTAATKDQSPAGKGLRHQSSTSSSSSSHTIRRSNCSSSGDSDINVAVEAPPTAGKEDTPTPVNSDSEQAELAVSAPPLSPRTLAGPDLSPLLSIRTSPGIPLSAKEVRIRCFVPYCLFRRNPC